MRFVCQLLWNECAVIGDPGTGTQTFAYDGLNRVTQGSGLAAGSRVYTYDRDGNRKTKTEGGTTFTYFSDRTDELISVQKGILVTQSFAYDTFGNLTTDAQTGIGTTTSTYDKAGKLTGIDTAGSATKTTFTFDALGRFATRLIGPAGSPTRTDTYSYAGASETVARIHTVAGSTIDTDSIVDPAGDRLGVKQGASVNWFLPDLHGNVAASLQSDELKLTNAIRYDPYGQTIATGAQSGASSPVGQTNWLYQGRLDVSPISGSPLYDMSARFYAPGIGAFTQFDSVMGSAQDPLSMNRFLYAEANPATMTDPTGHASVGQGQACSAMADFCDAARTTSSQAGSSRATTRTVNRHARSDTQTKYGVGSLPGPSKILSVSTGSGAAADDEFPFGDYWEWTRTQGLAKGIPEHAKADPLGAVGFAVGMELGGGSGLSGLVINGAIDKVCEGREAACALAALGIAAVSLGRYGARAVGSRELRSIDELSDTTAARLGKEALERLTIAEVRDIVVASANDVASQGFKTLLGRLSEAQQGVGFPKQIMNVGHQIHTETLAKLKAVFGEDNVLYNPSRGIDFQIRIADRVVPIELTSGKRWPLLKLQKYIDSGKYENLSMDNIAVYSYPCVGC